MSAGTSEFFCLICLLLCSCTAQKIVTAKRGQDVILPCKVPNINNINDITAVGWSRPDLDPEHVLLYRDGRFDPHNQHPSYQNRVDLQDKEMKDGDVSLILKNVKMEDTGTYVCRVSKKGKAEPISIINLKVHPPAQKIVTAKHGQDVILPCKVPNINNITAVEWIRPDLDPEYVLLSRDGRFDPDNQHPSYQNRVELQDKEMKDGDVSLILKNMKMEDTGTYGCRVFQGQKAELISIIYLEVLPPDDSWKTIVGVVVLLVVIILSAVGFAVYNILQIRKRKTLENEIQKDIEQLKRNNPENINPLQQKTQENETQQNEVVELKGNNPEINNQLQQEEQENEALKNQLEVKLKRGHSDASIELQHQKLKKEALESRLKKKLKRGHSDASIELQLEKMKNEALMNHLMKLKLMGPNLQKMSLNKASTAY